MVNRVYVTFSNRTTSTPPPFPSRAFNAAFTVRLLGFEPTDAQVANDLKSLPGLETFPSGGDPEHLEHQAEVIMHDFAACILGELERWMLNASPAMIEFNSLVDSADFTGAGPLESVQTRLQTDEVGPGGVREELKDTSARCLAFD